jgi:hypothetical protein
MNNIRNYALILSLAGNVVFAYLLHDGALLKAWKQQQETEHYLPDVIRAGAPDGIKIAIKPCDYIGELATGMACQ